MKRFSLFFPICILLLGSETTLTQTASNYYLPLRVGNYLQSHTSQIPLGSTWGARIATYTIEGSDSIFGRQYFREKDMEVMDVTLETHVSGFWWLRKDSVGNVALGAMSSSGSSNLDSAILASGYLLANEDLIQGHSRTYPYGKLFWQDSVLSVTETVSVLAGTFNNCLKISNTHFDSTGTAVYREYHYYAYGIGLVKTVRTLPVSEAHTDELIGYVTTGIGDGALNRTPQGFSLSQNYPNPFNPSTVISFQVANLGKVSLKVYDLLGREVATLVNEVKSAGSYTATFNAANMPSGVYFYRLNAGPFTETKRLVLLK